LSAGSTSSSAACGHNSLRRTPPDLYALTIIAGAIGEWNYYILGSAIDVMALAAIVYYSWTWPTEAPPTSMT
jgi:hypothetical protein